MIIENRWPWGKQLSLGIILMIFYIILGFFVYGSQLLTTAIFIFGYSVISAGLVYWSLGSWKVFQKRVRVTAPLKLWTWVLAGAFVILAFAAQWPAMFAVTLHSKAMLATTLIAVGTGIFEESLFRGTFFSVFMANMQYRSRSYQLTRSAIYSSIIFGLIHLTNVIGGNLQAVLQQVVYAMAFGLFLCVIRVMTNTLLWVIIIHTVADWAPATATGSGPTEVSSWWLIVGVFGLLMLVSLVYLVKVDRLLERSANLGMPNEQGG